MSFKTFNNGLQSHVNYKTGRKIIFFCSNHELLGIRLITVKLHRLSFSPSGCNCQFIVSLCKLTSSSDKFHIFRTGNQSQLIGSLISFQLFLYSIFSVHSFSVNQCEFFLNC